MCGVNTKVQVWDSWVRSQPVSGTSRPLTCLGERDTVRPWHMTETLHPDGHIHILGRSCTAPERASPSCSASALPLSKRGHDGTTLVVGTTPSPEPLGHHPDASMPVCLNTRYIQALPAPQTPPPAVRTHPRRVSQSFPCTSFQVIGHRLHTPLQAREGVPPLEASPLLSILTRGELPETAVFH